MILLEDEIVVRSFWGPREESVEAAVERWVELSGRLTGIGGTVFSSWTNADDEPQPLEFSVEGLQRELAHREEKFGPRGRLGFSMSAHIDDGDLPRVSLSSTVGACGSYVGNSLVLTLYVWEQKQGGLWTPMAGDLLRAVAEACEPDWGEVRNDALADAQNENPQITVGTPRAGYVTYLSSNRRARVSGEVPGRTRQATDGGLLIDMTEDGRFPELDAVAELDRRLRDSGALVEIPESQERL
ncbi:Imm52 family immunity protein [Actinomadura sp. 3N508]|uniref:Imm52 family immunity protein n=1 Tax=Actinomadura sp. 3N508 TaxID=3375153 RepID=UPI00378C2902